MALRRQEGEEGAEVALVCGVGLPHGTVQLRQRLRLDFRGVVHLVRPCPAGLAFLDAGQVAALRSHGLLYQTGQAVDGLLAQGEGESKACSNLWVSSQQAGTGIVPAARQALTETTTQSARHLQA